MSDFSSRICSLVWFVYLNYVTFRQALSVASIKRVLAEVQDLMTNPPEDIRVQFNEEDITDITAFIRGPGALFER